MNRYVDVDESALLQARNSLERAENHAMKAIGEINHKINQTSAANNAAQGMIQAKFGQVNANIGTVQSKIGMVQSKLARAKSTLASCRPPFYVDVPHTTSQGGVYYTKELRDPDREKREQAKAEIAECESKLSLLNSALTQMQSVLTRYYQGLAACKSVSASIQTASDLSSRASSKFETAVADIERTIRRAEECINDYQHVRIEGTYDGSVGELPLLSYAGGRVSYAPKGGAFFGTSTTAVRLPINEKADRTFADKEDFRGYVDALLKKGHGVSITIRIPKSMVNFPKDLPLGEVAKILEEKGFSCKRNAAGLRLVDPEGYYKFVKES
ncbi:MAG: hypothetical protein J6038_01880 [Bacilli bacterium]|nr:hypothetical protein [Bacilli bacterium]